MALVAEQVSISNIIDVSYERTNVPLTFVLSYFLIMVVLHAPPITSYGSL